MEEIAQVNEIKIGSHKPGWPLGIRILQIIYLLTGITIALFLTPDCYRCWPPLIFGWPLVFSSPFFVMVVLLQLKSKTGIRISIFLAAFLLLLSIGWTIYLFSFFKCSGFQCMARYMYPLITVPLVFLNGVYLFVGFKALKTFG